MIEKSNLDIPTCLKAIVDNNPALRSQLAQHYTAMRLKSLEDFMRVDIVSGTHENNRVKTQLLRRKVDIYEELTKQYSKTQQSN